MHTTYICSRKPYLTQYHTCRSKRVQRRDQKTEKARFIDYACNRYACERIHVYRKARITDVNNETSDIWKSTAPRVRREHVVAHVCKKVVYDFSVARLQLHPVRSPFQASSRSIYIIKKKMKKGKTHQLREQYYASIGLICTSLWCYLQLVGWTTIQAWQYISWDEFSS